MNLKYIVISIAIWLFVAITWIILFPFFFVLWFVTFPFDSRKVLTRKYTSLWGRLYLCINPKWKILITGKEKINRSKPRVVIANHQSMIDIFILYDVYPYYAWVSKKENYYVPILGWVMYLNNYIMVDRKNPLSFPKMFADCARELKKGGSVIIFPEGTRSPNGELGRFKEGAFKVAIDNKVPIIPIVFDGTYKLLLKKGKTSKSKKEVHIHVLDEVPYEKFPFYEPVQLKEYFKNIMAEELRKIRG
jgi:1-acyl-sn-glycerol-3-phosphate acyltransferase